MPSSTTTSGLNLTEVLQRIGAISLQLKNKRLALNDVTKVCREAVGSRACMLASIDHDSGRLSVIAISADTSELEAALNERSIAITWPGLVMEYI